MRKKEHVWRSTAEKGDERLKIEARDARERRHPGRDVVSRWIVDLSSDPVCIAQGADFREVRGAPAPEFAETMAIDAALPHEHLLAVARARGRCDDRTGDQAEAELPSHDL
jgi:hypothetical protein